MMLRGAIILLFPSFGGIVLHFSPNSTGGIYGTQIISLCISSLSSFLLSFGMQVATMNSGFDNKSQNRENNNK